MADHIFGLPAMMPLRKSEKLSRKTWFGTLFRWNVVPNLLKHLAHLAVELKVLLFDFGMLVVLLY